MTISPNYRDVLRQAVNRPTATQPA